MTDGSDSRPVENGRRAASLSRRRGIIAIIGLTVIVAAVLVAVIIRSPAADDQASACRAVDVAHDVLPSVVTVLTRGAGKVPATGRARSSGPAATSSRTTT